MEKNTIIRIVNWVLTIVLIASAALVGWIYSGRTNASAQVVTASIDENTRYADLPETNILDVLKEKGIQPAAKIGRVEDSKVQIALLLNYHCDASRKMLANVLTTLVSRDELYIEIYDWVNPEASGNFNSALAGRCVYDKSLKKYVNWAFKVLSNTSDDTVEDALEYSGYSDEELTACMNNYADTVRLEYDLFNQHFYRDETPTVIINGRYFSGYIDFTIFQRFIAEAMMQQ